MNRKAAAVFSLTLGLPAALGAGTKAPSAPVALTREFVHPSGAFSFRTPEDWRVAPSSTSPDAVEAWGGELGVRFVYRPGETGYDSLHADCIQERLAPPMDTDPAIRYEYEYLGGFLGDRRVLDSAFAVRYDRPVRGHRDWRQRTITVVGGGLSLCAMTYAPRAVWKNAPGARELLERVVGSLTFHEGGKRGSEPR